MSRVPKLFFPQPATSNGQLAWQIKNRIRNLTTLRRMIAPDREEETALELSGNVAMAVTPHSWDSFLPLSKQALRAQSYPQFMETLRCPASRKTP